MPGGQRDMSSYRRPSDRHRRRRLLGALALVVLAGAVLGSLMVATDTLGAGDKFDRLLAKIDRAISGPPPNRAGVGTVLVTAPPSEPPPTPVSTPTPTPFKSLAPGATPPPTPAPTPTPTPTPKRVAMNVEIAKDPAAIFAHEQKETWCAPAGVQMTLAFLGLADTSDRFQRDLNGRVKEWESYQDSHNGLWGPSAMALALDAYGAPGYEVRGYESRLEALRDAAVAIETTHSPVILLAWRGAHTWVMTGFKSDSDPAIFPYAKISGAYILDPWFPWASSIWGQSDPPGTFQDASEMERNYLRWKRPEGSYPDRDGLFIAVVPTVIVPTE
jgi:hypothetical protein